MLIATHSCCFKCLTEQNLDLSICQNSHLNLSHTEESCIYDIINRYEENILSECIIFAGLEPMLQFDEIYEFINEFRKKSDDDVIIFTGYYENEISEEINRLKNFKNIIIKFGRYIQNSEPRYDDVLKIKLISNNQYAKRVEDL